MNTIDRVKIIYHRQIKMWYLDRLKEQYQTVSDRARRSDRAKLLTWNTYTDKEIARALFLKQESGYAEEITVNGATLNENGFDDAIGSLKTNPQSTIKFHDVRDNPQILTVKPTTQGLLEILDQNGPLKNVRAEWWGTSGDPLKDYDGAMPWHFFGASGGNSKPI